VPLGFGATGGLILETSCDLLLPSYFIVRTTGVSVYHNVQLSEQVDQLNQLVLQGHGEHASTDQKVSSQLSDLANQVNQISSTQTNMKSQLKDLENKTADIDSAVH
jgi:hypothetical protein